MAATLDVHVRTIAKWEAAAPPTVNPFLKFIWVSITRHSSRLYKYGSVLLPKAYLSDVRKSPCERSVYVGSEAVVLTMSEETKRTWGMFRHAEGMSVAAFMGKTESSMMADNYTEMAEICKMGDRSRVVSFLTSEAPLGSTPPLWRAHLMYSPFPEILDMFSIPISKETFHGSDKHFQIIRAPEIVNVLMLQALTTQEIGRLIGINAIKKSA